MTRFFILAIFFTPFISHSENIGWALGGTSFIATKMYKAMHGANHRVPAIWSRSDENLTKFCNPRNIISHERFTSFPDALNASGVNAVWIGTPNQAHLELCLEAFNKPHIMTIVSEKSLEATVDRGEALIEALSVAQLERLETEKPPIIFREGIFYLNHPIMILFKEVIESGILGDVKEIIAEYGRDLRSGTNGKSYGVTNNMGPYPISLVHLVIKTLYGPQAFEKRSLEARGLVQTDKQGSESDYLVKAQAFVTFANGVKANIRISEIDGKSPDFNGVTIVGINATLRFITNPFSPIGGKNQFDIRFNDGRIQKFVRITEAHQDGYYFQMKMAEYDTLFQRREASSPAVNEAGSKALMSFYQEFRSAALSSDITIRAPLSELDRNHVSKF